MTSRTSVQLEGRAIDAWQDRQLEWQRRMFPGDPSPVEGGLGVFEEVGELTHAELKTFQGARYGVEPRYRDRDFAALARDACADAVIFGLSLANCLGKRLSEEMPRARRSAAAADLTASTMSPVLRAVAEAGVHAGLLMTLTTYDRVIPALTMARLGLVVAWIEVYAGLRNVGLPVIVETTLTDVVSRTRG